MNQTTLSKSTRAESGEWPANALPRPMMDRLFARMVASYGARFADAWRGTEPEEVKRVWAIRLAKLSSQQLRAGVDALDECKFPPTLPEFVDLCQRSRIAQEQQKPAAFIEAPKPSPEVVDENVEKAKQAVSKAFAAKEWKVEWAFKGLARGTALSGRPLPIGVIDVHVAAIRSPAGREFMRNAPHAAQYRELFDRTIAGSDAL